MVDLLISVWLALEPYIPIFGVVLDDGVPF